MNSQAKCCKRPAIAVMDYKKPTNMSWTVFEQMVNRCCTHCYAHWFGTQHNVKQYTRAEWDEYIGAKQAA